MDVKAASKQHLEDMSNYEINSKVIHVVCTKKEIKEYLRNPDEEHIVGVIIGRVAITLHDNNTLPFSSHEQEDVLQMCWQRCLEILGSKKLKYNYKTPLFGYLHKACINWLLRLKRDTQWRNDIVYQKACKKCKHRDTCTRKVSYVDLDTPPTCKAKAAALIRNQSKHALSVQSDYNVTEPIDHRSGHQTVDLNDIVEFFGERIPEKYQYIFHKLLNGRLTGIPKNKLLATRRWCWKILKRLDMEQYEYYKRAYYNSYQRELMKKLRKVKKNDDS